MRIRALCAWRCGSRGVGAVVHNSDSLPCELGCSVVRNREVGEAKDSLYVLEWVQNSCFGCVSSNTKRISPPKYYGALARSGLAKVNKRKGFVFYL